MNKNNYTQMDFDFDLTKCLYYQYQYFFFFFLSDVEASLEDSMTRFNELINYKNKNKTKLFLNTKLVLLCLNNFKFNANIPSIIDIYIYRYYSIFLYLI